MYPAPIGDFAVSGSAVSLAKKVGCWNVLSTSMICSMTSFVICFVSVDLLVYLTTYSTCSSDGTVSDVRRLRGDVPTLKEMTLTDMTLLLTMTYTS